MDKQEGQQGQESGKQVRATIPISWVYRSEFNCMRAANVLSPGVSWELPLLVSSGPLPGINVLIELLSGRRTGSVRSTGLGKGIG